MARVLVVDDDIDTAETFARLLSHWGHEARACYSGEEALVAAALFRPDAALVDLHLAGMTGAALARALSPRPWLVALTGLHPSLIASADADLFDRLLYKPVEPEELRGVLGELTATRRP
jgi:CheY-like chemotaxis protein